MQFCARFPCAGALFLHVPTMPRLIQILNHRECGSYCHNEARVISWSPKSSVHILSEGMVLLVALWLLGVLLLFHPSSNHQAAGEDSDAADVG